MRVRVRCPISESTSACCSVASSGRLSVEGPPWSRQLVKEVLCMTDNLTPEQTKLSQLWDNHTGLEFGHKDTEAALATMTEGRAGSSTYRR